MNKFTLELRCIDLFGDEKGEILYEAIRRVAYLDFCVATAWTQDQMSIARACNARGRIFKLTPDCKSLILPDSKIISTKTLRPLHILHYLPKINKYAEQKHCYLDSSPLNHAEL